MTNPIIDEYGTKRWYNEAGQLHNPDGPAIIYANGAQHWYFNDKLHRTDGPAIIGSDVYQEYWIHGTILTEDQFKEITQSEEHLNWYLLKIL